MESEPQQNQNTISTTSSWGHHFSASVTCEEQEQCLYSVINGEPESHHICEQIGRPQTVPLLSNGLETWDWCQMCKITPYVEYLPGKENCCAYWESCHIKTKRLAVVPNDLQWSIHLTQPPQCNPLCQQNQLLTCSYRLGDHTNSAYNSAWKKWSWCVGIQTDTLSATLADVLNFWQIT